MACHRPGDKPLSAPMMVSLLMHGLNEFTTQPAGILMRNLLKPDDVYLLFGGAVIWTNDGL